VIVVEVARISDSCGYGVPFMNLSAPSDNGPVAKRKGLQGYATTGPRRIAEASMTSRDSSLVVTRVRARIGPYCVRIRRASRGRI